MKISVLLAALLLLFSCTDKDSKQSQDLIVKTAQAVSASGIKTTEFPFIAQPFRTSELSFRVGGPIDRLDVYAGNHYKQGSIIAEIDRVISIFAKNGLKPSITKLKLNLSG